MKKEKKVFIFDFDGVFYSGKHKFEHVKETVHAAKRNFLRNLSDSQYQQICKENPNWEKIYTGQDIVEFIYELTKKYTEFNISTKEFCSWQETNPYKIIIDYSQVIDKLMIQSLSKKYPVYIVSNSSTSHIKFYMDKLDIKYSWFKKVYSNEFLSSDFTKKHYYQDILKTEKCSPNNSYVFGDNKQHDLDPATELGINTIFIKNSNDIKNYNYNILNNKSL